MILNSILKLDIAAWLRRDRFMNIMITFLMINIVDECPSVAKIVMVYKLFFTSCILFFYHLLFCFVEVKLVAREFSEDSYITTHKSLICQSHHKGLSHIRLTSKFTKKMFIFDPNFEIIRRNNFNNFNYSLLSAWNSTV